MILRIDLTDLEAYQIFNSVRLHFTNSHYDFGKYRLNKKQFSLERFNSRPENRVYVAVAKNFLYKGRWLPHCAINQFYMPGVWIHAMLEPSQKARGLKFRGYLSQFWNAFENDLIEIYPMGQCKAIFEPFEGITSRILDLVRAEKVSPITAVMLAKIGPMLHNKCCFEKSFVQDSIVTRLEKLTTFVPRVDDYNLGVGRQVLERVWYDRKHT